MRPRLLPTFAAASLTCSLFILILWTRASALGEIFEWQSIHWPGKDHRVAHTLALLTRDDRLTLVYDHEARPVFYRSRRSRDTARTTFRWERNNHVESLAPPADTFLSRLGFSKSAQSESLSFGRARTISHSTYRYSLPFWFLTTILLLPPATWLHRRRHRRGARVKNVAPPKSPPAKPSILL